MTAPDRQELELRRHQRTVVAVGGELFSEEHVLTAEILHLRLQFLGAVRVGVKGRQLPELADRRGLVEISEEHESIVGVSLLHQMGVEAGQRRSLRTQPAFFVEPFLGRLDPRTGEHVEYAFPVLKPGFPTGTLAMEPDNDGNWWLALMFQGGLAKALLVKSAG